jgi:hypothetical protein
VFIGNRPQTANVIIIVLAPTALAAQFQDLLLSCSILVGSSHCLFMVVVRINLFVKGNPSKLHLRCLCFRLVLGSGQIFLSALHQLHGCICRKNASLIYFSFTMVHKLLQYNENGGQGHA